VRAITAQEVLMIGVYILVRFVGAIWAAAVAGGKNLNMAVFAILGFLLPLIGVLIAYGVPAKPEEA
jgi:hypothetical protein